MYDRAFSVISWALMKEWGSSTTNADFSADSVECALSVVAANIWRRRCRSWRIAFSARSAGRSSLRFERLRSTAPRRWQRSDSDAATLTPYRGGDERFRCFSPSRTVLADHVITVAVRLNATNDLLATLSVQRAISGGSLGEGAAIATMMSPFLTRGRSLQPT